MSSYVTSPYEIEDRRLRGIVQTCTENLNIAISNLKQAQDEIQANRQKQRQQDKQYGNLNREADARLQQDMEKKQAQVKAKKLQLEEMLADMQTQIDAFQQQFGLLANADSHQKDLAYMLKNAGQDILLVEQKIKEHIKSVQKEMQTKVSAKSYESFRSACASMKSQRTQGGVSLQDIDSQEPKRKQAETPIDVFTAKMMQAMKSPYAKRISQLASLKKQFESEAEFRKSAFAIRNMKLLDEILDRLIKMEQQNAASREQVSEQVLRYKALCEFLDIEEDEGLLAGAVNSIKLEQVCKEYERQYVEKEKRQHVIHAFTTVLGRHGIVLENIEVNDGMLFSMDGASLEVSGAETDYVSMEVVGEYAGEAPTLNERRKTASTATHFCSLLGVIEDELREEFGIVFKKIATKPPAEASITMKKAGSVRKKAQYSGKKTMSVD